MKQAYATSSSPTAFSPAKTWSTPMAMSACAIPRTRAASAVALAQPRAGRRRRHHRIHARRQAGQRRRRPPYLERFIHGAIYETRPEVMAVIHSHAEDMLPFGMTQAAQAGDPFRQRHRRQGADLGHRREIRTDDQSARRNMEQGRDLAKTLGNGRVVLMRGHGFAAAAAR